mmetsp:Transcript_320/g.854  ORF Transcript_320/g.854 Transcript_320/m.854 type:complete len:290 (-) Transcript_320:962-1831(-)
MLGKDAFEAHPAQMRRQEEEREGKQNTAHDPKEGKQEPGWRYALQRSCFDVHILLPTDALSLRADSLNSDRQALHGDFTDPLVLVHSPVAQHSSFQVLGVLHDVNDFLWDVRRTTHIRVARAGEVIAVDMATALSEGAIQDLAGDVRLSVTVGTKSDRALLLLNAACGPDVPLEEISHRIPIPQVTRILLGGGLVGVDQRSIALLAQFRDLASRVVGTHVARRPGPAHLAFTRAKVLIEHGVVTFAIRRNQIAVLALQGLCFREVLVHHGLIPSLDPGRRRNGLALVDH